MTDSDETAWIIHDGHRIESVSAALCALFRCEPEALVDSPIDSIIASEDLRGLARFRGLHIMEDKSGRVWRQGYDFLRFDGTVFWGEAHSSRLDDTRFRTIIVWSYDIHEPGF